jgi:hypothetical protein
MAISSSAYIDLATAIEQFPIGSSTLRNHIKAGHVAAVKIRGKVHVKPEDLDAFLSPTPILVADGTLKDWAERMAAKAPAFRPEQRDIIVSAFNSALGGCVTP